MGKTAFSLCFLLAVVLASGVQAQAPAPAPAVECEETLLAFLRQNVGLLRTLLDAVEAAGLSETLEDPALTVTLLAPTNSAFENRLEQLGVSADDLLNNVNLLTDILTYHLLPANYPDLDSSEYDGAIIETELDGETIEVNVDGNQFSFSSPATVASGRRTRIFSFCNWSLYTIDDVLIPESVSSAISS